jgi:CubicO group peptidase (beta-lactamase class C family)
MDRRTLLRAAGASAIAIPLARSQAALGTLDRRSRLDRKIRALMAEAPIPGLGVAVTHGAHVKWAAGYGLANVGRGLAVKADTPFMLASISKTVTCAAVMQAVEDGILDLDHDVNRYLPWPVRNPHHPSVPISLRMLLTHTSSLRDDWRVFTRFYVPGDSTVPLGGFLRRCLTPGADLYEHEAWFQRDRPGRRYLYCNLGVALAGYIVEAASGIPFSHWCDRRIFRPLQMGQTSWFLEGLHVPSVAVPYKWTGSRWRSFGQYGYPDYPDGELRTSARSLARFLTMFVAFGRRRDTRILSRASVQEIRRQQVPKLVPGQGLVWYRIRMRGDAVLGHTGGDSGVSTRMFFRPSDGKGAIVLANGDTGASGWRQLRRIQGLLLEEG